MTSKDPSRPGDSGLAAQYSADPRHVADLYDGWAQADYDADLAAWRYEAPARAAELAIAAMANPTTDTVLDAGCGTGLVGVELHRLGATNILGGDFSEASAAVALQRGVYNDVVHLDLNEPLEFADGAFQCVVSVGVFSYLTDSRSTIDELLRVVAPGGAVVFTQRTDLWADRDFDALVESLVSQGRCSATVSDKAAYLPGHPEFGDDIGIRYATLRQAGPH